MLNSAAGMSSSASQQPQRHLAPAPTSYKAPVPSVQQGYKRPLEEHHHSSSEDEDMKDESKRQRAKGKGKGAKACVFCRRSHMVCEGGRPCNRCIKREIADKCRDESKPQVSASVNASAGPSRANSIPAPTRTTSSSQLGEPSVEPSNGFDPAAMPPSNYFQQDQSIYPDSSLPPSWPMLPDTGSYNAADGSNGLMGMLSKGAVGGQAEFGILSNFLESLRVPDLPGGFVDVLSQVVRGDEQPSALRQGHNPVTTLPTMPAPPSVTWAPPESTNGKGKAKDEGDATSKLNGISRLDKYLLAAADQPSGPRASRLAQVIRAKFEAGLLKPYDYMKGYARMLRWMDSSTTGAVSAAPSRQNSPVKDAEVSGNGRVARVSPESRRRILAALAGFRPRFRQIARGLTDVDLVFIEEAHERLMLDYDRFLASIHTPHCIWRRTGEIQKANKEFAMLTGIPAERLRSGRLCIYELMDESSAVRYWEDYGRIAFDAGQRSILTTCVLRIPAALTRSPNKSTPRLRPTNAVAGLEMPDAESVHDRSRRKSSKFDDNDEARVIECCFSVTIRRDAWGIPIAVVGAFIPT